MTDLTKNFLEFSKPFIEGLKEVFSTMMQTEVTPCSPKLKDCALTLGEFTAVIGMNGKLNKNGQSKNFRGQIGVSFSEEVFLKVASAMLMEEYTEYCEDIADTAGEIVNIVMGSAKKSLAPEGYEIGMATPTTIKGKNVEIKYPKGASTIVTAIESDLGTFTFEICYQEISL